MLVAAAVSGTDEKGPDNELAVFIARLVHFALFGVASQAERRPSQCPQVALRRGFVPLLAGALFDTKPAARSASATRVEVWPLAISGLPETFAKLLRSSSSEVGGMATGFQRLGGSNGCVCAAGTLLVAGCFSFSSLRLGYEM